MELLSRSTAPLSANLLSNVYATVGREDLWPAAMETVCTEFGATGVAIRHYDFLRRSYQNLYRCSHLSTADEPFLTPPPLGTAGWPEVDRRFHSGTVVFGIHLNAGNGNGTGPIRNPNEELPHSHVLHGVLYRTRWHAQVISMQRSAASPAFDAVAVKLLEQLLAHLSQATSLGQSVEARLRNCSAFITLLQHLPLACLLVNRQSYVRFVNRAAEAMLGGSELCIVADRLCGRNSKTSGLLWRTVSHTAANYGANYEVSLTLPNVEDTPLVLKLFPVQENTSHLNDPEAMVAIIAKDPKGTTFSSLTRLSEIYRLTPAESRLVGCLSGGAGLFEAAGKIGISRNTARTHMRHAYAKLNVHCQADLMRLLSHFGML